ncbi:DNA-binding protein HU-beta [Acholeplasma morum]|jgi:DNA-binding protein HU-beta|uniref:HU family DNA-binding protein n=1 Tax=Paracholeplasma morum TaxID=264637 RepID=UPI001956A51C|nr:HU family DNA-binding protein [Paracholeplasma morum]MBM7453774.1 DNA-binding protein HU-beta [Paracholeplasma morum]
MNKTELIAVVAEKSQVTKKVAEEVLNAFVESVAESLGKHGEKVVLTGFGTFEVRNRAQREGRDPRSGETIHIPAQKTPAFKAGKVLKDAVK